MSFDVRVIGVMVTDDGYSLDEALSTVDDLGFEIDEAEVIYWGRCPACTTSDSS